MASAFLKLLVLSLCLNTFLYFGVNYALFEGIPADQRPDMQDDLFSILMDDPEGTRQSLDTYVENLGSTKNSTYSIKLAMAGNFSEAPSEARGSTVLPEGGGFSFIDMIKMVMPFIRTLWRIGTMPITLFSYNLLPPLAAVAIALPLFLLNVMTLVIFIRGGGAV